VLGFAARWGNVWGNTRSLRYTASTCSIPTRGEFSSSS